MKSRRDVPVCDLMRWLGEQRLDDLVTIDEAARKLVVYRPDAEPEERHKAINDPWSCKAWFEIDSRPDAERIKPYEPEV